VLKHKPVDFLAALSAADGLEVELGVLSKSAQQQRWIPKSLSVITKVEHGDQIAFTIPATPSLIRHFHISELLIPDSRLFGIENN
jgi:hypothetical protein